MKVADPRTPRLRDAAALLPALAMFLLMPPLVTLFTGAHRLGGVPMIVVYLFGVWLALIVAAALLARRLERAQDASATASTPAPGPASVPAPVYTGTTADDVPTRPPVR